MKAEDEAAFWDLWVSSMNALIALELEAEARRRRTNETLANLRESPQGCSATPLQRNTGEDQPGLKMGASNDGNESESGRESGVQESNTAESAQPARLRPDARSGVQNEIDRHGLEEEGGGESGGGLG